MTCCHQICNLDDALYPCDKDNQPMPEQGLNFSGRERWLPRVYLVVYGLFFVGFVVVLQFAPGALALCWRTRPDLEHHSTCVSIGAQDSIIWIPSRHADF